MYHNLAALLTESQQIMKIFFYIKHYKCYFSVPSFCTLFNHWISWTCEICATISVHFHILVIVKDCSTDKGTGSVLKLILKTCTRGLKRDVYLCWPIAPSCMSPNAGGGELRDLNQWVVHRSPNKLWRTNSIYLSYGMYQGPRVAAVRCSWWCCRGVWGGCPCCCCRCWWLSWAACRTCCSRTACRCIPRTFPGPAYVWRSFYYCRRRGFYTVKKKEI